MTERRGWAVWLTGLPASGKTTIARALWQRLGSAGVPAAILDSDELRRVITPEPTFSPTERDQVYTALVDLAALLTGYGVNVIIAATGSRRAYRQAARTRLMPFAEVWVVCPPELCRARDPKGLYAQAAAGIISNLPGIDASYEAPEAPDLTIDSARQTPAENVATMMLALPFLRERSPD